MDRFNARLVSAIADILLEIELQNPQEQFELHTIGRRLRTLSIRIADDLSCERISEELERQAPPRLPRKFFS